MLSLKRYSAGIRALSLLLLVLSCLNPAHGAWGGSRGIYVSHLLAFEGVPYARMNCSQFVCMAKQHNYCSSAEIYRGCNGAFEIVEQAASLSEIDYSRLRAGDIAAFHGVHVAAYVTGTTWLDSDPEHGGVGLMKATPFDPWFKGPIRILRWTS
jgi:hypothetical protein